MHKQTIVRIMFGKARDCVTMARRWRVVFLERGYGELCYYGAAIASCVSMTRLWRVVFLLQDHGELYFYGKAMASCVSMARL